MLLCTCSFHKYLCLLWARCCSRKEREGGLVCIGLTLARSEIRLLPVFESFLTKHCNMSTVQNGPCSFLHGCKNSVLNIYCNFITYVSGFPFSPPQCSLKYFVHKALLCFWFLLFQVVPTNRLVKVNILKTLWYCYKIVFQQGWVLTAVRSAVLGVCISVPPTPTPEAMQKGWAFIKYSPTDWSISLFFF